MGKSTRMHLFSRIQTHTNSVNLYPPTSILCIPPPLPPSAPGPASLSLSLLDAREVKVEVTHDQPPLVLRHEPLRPACHACLLQAEYGECAEDAEDADTPEDGDGRGGIEDEMISLGST